MNEILSPAAQRDPYPFYERMRQAAPVHHDGKLWYLLDYPSVKRALSDHDDHDGSGAELREHLPQIEHICGTTGSSDSRSNG
jgi:cytochrome P450